MNERTIRAAKKMISIANDLDDLGMFSFSSMVEKNAFKILRAQTGIEDLVAPNLLDPNQVERVKDQREDEDATLEDMLDKDEEAVQDQEDNLEEHQDQVQVPLKDIVKR